ncbi:MAG TPA: hypothetical protein VFH82_13065, partial [Gemmatimonadota bacterium]|nr:hypothetical protein [Gemmatimonadota bacterium]
MTPPDGARSTSLSMVPLAGRFFLLLAGAIAALLAGGLAAACRSTPPPAGSPVSRPAPAPVFAAEPIVRVGVALGDTALALGSGERWWIHEAGVSRPIAVVDGEPGWRVVRLPFETALRLRRPDGWLSQPHVGPLVAGSLGGTPIEAAGVSYPGT